MNQIYTAGYSGHSVTQLKQAAEALNARVIDIRLSPNSRDYQWGRAIIEKSLGWRYYYLRALGNENYASRGPIKIHDPKLGLDIVEQLLHTNSLILLCQCPDYNSCHRAVISQMLRTRHLVTQELAWPESEAAGTIKGLTLWEPWGTLIAVGAKRIETRSWSTGYRGSLAIHTAKTQKPIQDLILETNENGLRLMPPFGPALKGHKLHFGYIVALADLVDCKPTEELWEGLSEHERAFGNYAPGRFGWILEDVRPLEMPIAYRGAQGLFDVPTDVLKEGGL